MIVELEKLDKWVFRARREGANIPVVFLTSDVLITAFGQEAYDATCKPMKVGDVKLVEFDLREVKK
jgi:hypothetical protein